MLTRAQTWSEKAFASIKLAKSKPDSAKYRTSCRIMPGLIHQSGALQALVFQVARDAAGRRYVDDLAAAYFATQPGANIKGHEALIQHAQRLELLPYLALTRDLAEIAQWFRRFGQIVLKEGEDDGAL